MADVPTTRDFSNRTWPSWTEPNFIDVDGLSTAYRRGGSGPTLVYLHGGGGTRSWSPLHAKLAEHFDLIAPEHPGFGDTDRPDHIDGWTDFVLHYDAFFRSLDLDQFHLVGTSLGAWLAADLASFFPERYSSITLITPLGARIVDEPFIDVFRFTPEQDLDAAFNGRAGRYLDSLVQGTDMEMIAQGYLEGGTSAMLFWNPRYDIKLDTRLKRVLAPTLVVAVDDDRIAGNQQAARFQDLIPGSSLVQIHGPDGLHSGHAVTIEQPNAVVDAILAHTRTVTVEGDRS